MLLAAALLIAGTASAQRLDQGERGIVQVSQALKNGEFVWAPELSPDGPILMVVNLATQRALLFRNGIPIAASSVSTGKPGYETPTGVFTVLEKKREHYSKTYDNAPMPNMQRLTWKGIALHAGKLPGYPASHGCIRLPPQFSSLLFSATHVGMTVVITRPWLNLAFFDPRPLSDFTSAAPGVDAWLVGGHSLGGVRACQLAPDADGLVLFGSYCANDLSDSGLPVLSISGAEDGLSTPEKIQDSRGLLPADAEFVEIAGAAHASFGDYGPQAGDGTPTISERMILALQEHLRMPLGELVKRKGTAK